VNRIALYGNFGSGNLGNECTLRVVVEAIRERWPEAGLLCICTVPDDVQARHRLDAVRALIGAPAWAPGDGSQPQAPELGQIRPASGATRAISRALRLVFRRIPLEVVHWIKGFRLMLGVDMLIVPGTGIVSDYLCGPAGWPYDIFKWSTLAALCRVKLVFLSIGVGPIRHPASRRLIHRSLALATYRSYRDVESKRYLEHSGFPTGRDGVYPDLVFGLPQQQLSRHGTHRLARRVVGLGLKDYSGAGGPEGATAYRDYLDTMADFVVWLLGQDYVVRLLIGDLQYDTRTRQELTALLKHRGIAPKAPRVIAEDSPTVEELLRQIGETDVVVSPRFHNLVLGMMLDKPVLALSDHAKLDSLLNGLGLAQYRVSLEHLRAETLIDRFQELESGADRVMPHVREELQRYRHALQEQYATIFSLLHHGTV
jgi:polysaccharide pyruvyl transferase WcaK-like protein